MPDRLGGHGRAGRAGLRRLRAWVLRALGTRARPTEPPRPRRPLDDDIGDHRSWGVIRWARLGRLRWQAWSLGLVNPRYGATRRAAARRAQADLDHEWRTGHVAPHQRRLRAVRSRRA